MVDLGPMHSLPEGPCRHCGRPVASGDVLGPVHPRCRAQAAAPDAPPVPRLQRDAVDDLRDILADGPALGFEVLAEMADLGHGEKATRKAKAELGVRSTKDGMAASWWWELPAEGCPTCGQRWPMTPEGDQPHPADPPQPGAIGTPSTEDPPPPQGISAPFLAGPTTTDPDLTACSSCGAQSYMPVGAKCIRPDCRGVSL